VDYQVAYTVTQQPFAWEPLAIGTLFIVVGVLILIAARPVSAVTRRSLTYVRVFGVIFLTFALCWTGVIGLFTTTTSSRYLEHLRTGQYQIAEGVVGDFRPMPYEGHALEQFTVAGVGFAYSDYVITGAFNTTRSHGGPITAGMHVKIYYTTEGSTPEYNRILWLGIKK
jgi:hypothetical protein